MKVTSTLAAHSKSESPFVGLAPFLRNSISGVNLMPFAQELLAQTEHDTDNANLLMNLSIAMQCVGQRDLGLAIQEQALALKRVYQIAASEQPAKIRLLMLMVPGRLAVNVPLECLLENSDVDLSFYYVSPHDPLALPVPEHDVLMVAICEDDAHFVVLDKLTETLANWPKPVINSPQHIPKTTRNAASRLLQDIPGLLTPPTLRISRATLLAIANNRTRLSQEAEGCDFPLILRPVGSQGGHGLERIMSADEIVAYLAKLSDEEFFISRFIDYSSADGLFRKMRVILIDGAPFVCHMAVSSNWMVHYVNAGMYEDAQKREEEADFMANFAVFAERHREALETIYQRTQLDYLCIDCAETKDGELLVFEIDPTMVVHAMDPEHLFPHKQLYMQKVKTAFRDFLLRLT